MKKANSHLSVKDNRNASVFGLFLLLAALLIPAVLSAGFNRSLFFRASSFYDQPRLEHPWLTTFEIQLLGGSNYIGRSCFGKKTNILSVYGPEDIKALSLVNPDHPLNLPGDPSKICFQAVADVFEADFNFYQNFSHGLFIHAHFPAILLQLFPSGFKNNVCTERSCKPCRQKKPYEPVWEQAAIPLQSFLDNYDICIRPQRQAAASDSTLFLGWTHSFDEICYIDFIDFTAETGVLIPTGKKRNPNQLFDIAYGYNGHWGIPLSFDFSVGAYDWLTWAAHFDSLFFIKKNQCIRMRTEKEATTGFIRLGKGNAVIHPGTVWRASTYLKADHFYNGLSFALGFTYEQKNRDHIVPCDQKEFSISHVNADQQYRSWSRGILHIWAEYDFAHEESCVGPRLGLFYDRCLMGKRVFDISMAGGFLGVDINWCY